jgi:hypothetical protein
MIKAAVELARKLLALLAVVSLLSWVLSVVLSKHHHAITFWLVVALGLLMLTFASAWLDERGKRIQLERVAAGRGPENLADRLDGIAHEVGLLQADIPAVFRDRAQERGFGDEVNAIVRQVNRELRLSAPRFLDYWKTNPPGFTFVRSPEGYRERCRISRDQLAHISARVRSGDDA